MAKARTRVKRAVGADSTGLAQLAELADKASYRRILVTEGIRRQRFELPI